MKQGIHSRTWLFLVATFAVAVVAGGLALGSNMGFKFNAQIVLAGAGTKGDNWLAVPDNNPYPKANNVCTQLGLTSTGPTASRGVVSRLTASTGALTNFTCGGNTLTAFSLVKGEAIKIRNNVTINGIVVGSDDPMNTIPIAAAGVGTKGDNWVSVPYHTTAVKANDLCTDMGLTSTGPTASRGVVSRLTASSGALTNFTCGGNTLTAFTVTVGEGIKVRNNVAKSWLASHF